MKKLHIFIIIVILVLAIICGLLLYNYNQDFQKEQIDYKKDINKVKQKQNFIDEKFDTTQNQKGIQIEKDKLAKKQKDEDRDGLTYEEEIRLGTSDNEKDSDGDGILDNEDRHPAGGGETQKITVRWSHNNFPYTTQFGIHEDKYWFYKDQKRGYCCDGWDKFTTPNDPIIQTIAKDITDVSISTGESCTACIAIDFVQSMLYEYDIEYNGRNEYPKYAIETIIDEKGDCEDTSFLMASILEAIGIDTVLFDLPGHMAIGVYCTGCDGEYYVHNGRDYYFLETTGQSDRWEIGRTSYDLSTDLKRVIDV